MSFRLHLYEFCHTEGEKLDYHLDVPVYHQPAFYDRLVYNGDSGRPTMVNTEDGSTNGIDNLSEDECRMVLIQVCRDRYSRLESAKSTIVANAGIGVFADELRYLQSCIEEATIYC